MQTKHPTVDEARSRVLKWFTGKSYENASHALDLLAASEAEGFWVPGASRKVSAALSKANVAIKVGKANRKALEALGSYRDPEDERGWGVGFLLYFSEWKRKDMNWEAIKAKTTDRQLHAVIDRAREFVIHFGSIRRLVKRLDLTRPKPVFTSIGASPTVSATLADMGLVSPNANLRMPEIKWERIEKLDPATGKVVGYHWVGELVWPPGTLHGKSRFASRFTHCHACGHAIKNPYNWVPLVMDKDNVPHSLWVGRDCAKTIFGVKMDGEFDIKDLGNVFKAEVTQ